MDKAKGDRFEGGRWEGGDGWGGVLWWGGNGDNMYLNNKKFFKLKNNKSVVNRPFPIIKFYKN